MRHRSTAVHRRRTPIACATVLPPGEAASVSNPSGSGLSSWTAHDDSARRTTSPTVTTVTPMVRCRLCRSVVAAAWWHPRGMYSTSPACSNTSPRHSTSTTSNLRAARRTRRVLRVPGEHRRRRRAEVGVGLHRMTDLVPQLGGGSGAAVGRSSFQALHHPGLHRSRSHRGTRSTSAPRQASAIPPMRTDVV